MSTEELSVWIMEDHILRLLEEDWGSFPIHKKDPNHHTRKHVKIKITVPSLPEKKKELSRRDLAEILKDEQIDYPQRVYILDKVFGGNA